MLDKIVKILKNSPKIDEWLINDARTESAELFFVGKNLDMNRAKKVHHIVVTVYRNFEENGKKYKGSASTLISPVMSEQEAAEKIEQAAYAATFVKNPYYKLAAPTDEPLKEITSDFSADELSSFMPKLVKALYKNDKYNDGGINSCEFFLSKTKKRIMNSSGVDETNTSYKGQIELIVNWKDDGEEVEIIEVLDFSDFDPIKIEKTVADTLENAKLRAAAVPTPKLEGIPVLLVKENVNELLRFYTEQSSAFLVYQKYSTVKVGENVQCSDLKGDPINITLLPEVKGSVGNAYIDADGIKLNPVELYCDGVLKCYHGDNRHCQYLGVTPTGMLGNVEIKGGKYALEELKNGPYLELRVFSDFQMDEWTGDFGGEIRLAVYNDGTKEIPVTGGSIVGNLKNAQASMLFSSELVTNDNFICPKAVKLFGVTVAV